MGLCELYLLASSFFLLYQPRDACRITRCFAAYLLSIRRYGAPMAVTNVKSRFTSETVQRRLVDLEMRS